MDREKFKQKAQKTIDEFSNQINELEQKKAQLSSKAEKNFKQKLNSLKSQKEKLETKYKEVEESSDLNWGIIHETFEDTAETLKTGVDELKEVVK